MQQKYLPLPCLNLQTCSVYFIMLETWLWPLIHNSFALCAIVNTLFSSEDSLDLHYSRDKGIDMLMKETDPQTWVHIFHDAKEICEKWSQIIIHSLSLLGPHYIADLKCTWEILCNDSTIKKSTFPLYKGLNNWWLLKTSLLAIIFMDLIS